jgi:hypothetical protein
MLGLTQLELPLREFFFSGAYTSKQYDLLKVLRFIQGYSGSSFTGVSRGYTSA